MNFDWSASNYKVITFLETFPMIGDKPIQKRTWDTMIASIQTILGVYFPNTEAIIYMVDSSDTYYMSITKDEFHLILKVLFKTWTIYYHLCELVDDWFSWWKMVMYLLA